MDGQWGDWAPVAACSTTCGAGVVLVNRTCDRPQPQYGGQMCTGVDTWFQLCDAGPCPGKIRKRTVEP